MIGTEAEANPDDLRSAFGAFPTGVTVVTTQTTTGEPVGFTANSFTSVSLDPPMLLVCPGRLLTSFDTFSSCTQFAVNVLAEGQEDIANTFARFKGDRFSAVAWTGDRDGLPLIDGVAAQFSCATDQAVSAGDHIVLIGKIREFTYSGMRGLGYAGGSYFSLGLERRASAPVAGRRSFAGAIAVCGDRVLLHGNDTTGFALPVVEVDHTESVRDAVIRNFRTHGVVINLGKAYSIFDGPEGEQFTYFLATTTSPDPGTMGHFVPTEDLAEVPVRGRPERATLLRFAEESRNRVFGFYVGDSASGYIHALNV